MRFKIYKRHNRIQQTLKQRQRLIDMVIGNMAT